MSDIPTKVLARRSKLSREFLSGDGIEVGALHHPLALGPRARVKYVDRYGVDDLRRHYPELGGYDLTPIDVVDDGETLSSFPDGELDFLVANHFLEHAENPIGTIRNHLSKVRPGGRLYFAVPNKRESFDRERALTTFDHLVADDRDGPERSRADHYRDWARRVLKNLDPVEMAAHAELLMEMKYSIHFHVWDARSFRDFLKRTRSHLGNAFEIEHFSVNGGEIVAILRKPGGTSSENRSPVALALEGLLRSLSAHWADWRGEARNLWTAIRLATGARRGRPAS